MIKTIPLITPRTPIQDKFMLDEHRFLVVSAGRRSRKTLIGQRKVLAKAMRNRGNKYFLGAPTRQQAKDIFWTGKYGGLRRTLPPALIKRYSDSELWIMLPNDAIVQVVGLDKPQRIEGQPWNGCMITEMGDVKPDAWEMNVRPVLADTLGSAILEGVPEGRNHYYDLALYAAGGAIPETKPLIGAYAENPFDPDWAFYSWFSADVLSSDEIAANKREMDERSFRQEYEGSFEGEEGRAYYAFGPHNISADGPAPKGEHVHIHIGMDFNVDPMTAVLCEVEGDTIKQFDEVYLRHSNTYEMATHLKTRKGIDPKKATIYPDSTGSAESSNATESDLKILRNAGFNVKARPANPRQRDRIVAVNTRCRASDGSVRYFVQHHCAKTINDMNRVQVDPDGRLDKDQKDSGLTHISDALGYLIAYLFPVRRITSLHPQSGEDFY
jgi:hypothetical protein